jgi:hypothetical protein
MVLDEVHVDISEKDEIQAITDAYGVVDEDEVEFWLRKRLDKMKQSIMEHLQSELQYHRYTNEAAVKIITPSWYKIWWMKVIQITFSNAVDL